jgi:hypothetical protein
MFIVLSSISYYNEIIKNIWLVFILYHIIQLFNGSAGNRSYFFRVIGKDQCSIARGLLPALPLDNCFIT